MGKDINNYTTAAYSHYGMDLDLGTEQGFFNYYSTDYVIWMNDAARAQLGFDGKKLQIGPVISPCYLMNVLFRALGWKGPSRSIPPRAESALTAVCPPAFLLPTPRTII